ncbi:MAG TPA: DUF4252 domain-containing protein [Terriglobia bacterium]|nr:DUF4252 domain-containing protein [Terriglobia bacterium]
MRNTIRTLGCGVALALGTAALAAAQSPKLDLGNLAKLADRADEVVDVTLDGQTLKFAEKFMEEDKDEDDAEALKLIKNLTGIYVKSFEFDKPDQYSEADVEAIRSQLHSGAWSRMVGYESKREHEKDEIWVMSDPNGKSNLGLAIIAAEAKELTVVNIVGPIDVNDLPALEGKMGVPHLDVRPNERGGSHADH